MCDRLLGGKHSSRVALELDNQSAWQPAQKESIAQALGSYNGGAAMDNISIGQRLWDVTDLEMRT